MARPPIRGMFGALQTDAVTHAAALHVALDSRLGEDGMLWCRPPGSDQHWPYDKSDADGCIVEDLRGYVSPSGAGPNGMITQTKARFRDLVTSRPRATFIDHPPRDTLQCQGETVEWRTGELVDYRPTHLGLPVVWDPGATCPAWDAWLLERMAGDADLVDLAWQITAAALIPMQVGKKLVLCWGPAHTGKSTFLNIVKGLVGDANTNSTSLFQLAERPFATAHLHGKLLVAHGEMDVRDIQRPSILKLITGDDWLSAEHKGKPAFQFRPYALPLFGLNEFPSARHGADALYQRYLLLPFREPITERDPTVERALLGELPGILQKAVRHLRALEAGRWQYTIPEASWQAHAEGIETIDSVLRFLRQECEEVEDWTERKALYRAYTAWCEGEGNRPRASQGFWSRYREVLGSRSGQGADRMEKMVNGERYVWGFRPTPPPLKGS